MNKYNYELDLTTDNSNSLIINMIKPNSKVLEFGPAYGRMTRYLKEKMLCEVDIVEIDQEAGLEAAKYANISCIGAKFGDIEKYNWLEHMGKEKYDYIIFADVLEHLYYPEKVLKICKNILNDDGSVLLSVPNIAHSSVLIGLLNNQFKYNSVGLLDKTHIRFFTYNSLLSLVSECGFSTVIEQAVYSEVGQNEIDTNYNMVNTEIQKELRGRDKGNVYQYVFKIEKKEYFNESSLTKIINYNSNLGYEFVCYIQEEGDTAYSEYKTIRKNINGLFNHISLSFEKFRSIKSIRIDPINTNCVIDIKFYIKNDLESKGLANISTNGINLCDSIYLFNTNDSQIYLDTGKTVINELIIDFNLYLYDSKFIPKLYEIWNKIKEVENKSVIELKNKYKDIIKFNEEQLATAQKNKEYHDEICQDQKDQYESLIKEKDQKIKEENQKLKDLEKLLYDKQLEVDDLNSKIYSINNSKLWKVRNFFIKR